MIKLPKSYVQPILSNRECLILDLFAGSVILVAAAIVSLA